MCVGVLLPLEDGMVVNETNIDLITTSIIPLSPTVVTHEATTSEC